MTFKQPGFSLHAGTSPAKAVTDLLKAEASKKNNAAAIGDEGGMRKAAKAMARGAKEAASERGTKMAARDADQARVKRSTPKAERRLGRKDMGMREGFKKSPMGPKKSQLSDEEIAKIKQSDAYKKFDEAGSEKKYTKEEHEANKANNAAVDQELLKYQKDYSDKHGSSSGGTDAEWNAYQQGLKDIRAKYKNR